MNLEEKINKLKDLFAQRDAVDAEIAQVLGDEETGQTMTGGPRVVLKVSPPREAGQKGCNACGSTGWRHKKGCKFEGAAKKKPKDEPTGTAEFKNLSDRRPGMDRRKFEQVKIAHQHQLDAEVIARNMGLPEKEVSRAIASKSFEAYADIN